MTRLLERLADRSDPAIHHVGWSDDVGAGLSLDERLLGQHLHGVVVDHLARRIGEAVVPVAGVRVERDVGQHSDLRHRVLDRLDRAADEVVGVERLARVVRAQLAGRVGEQGDAGNSEVGGEADAAGQLVDAPARHAGKRADRLLAVRALADEQGPDEVARVQPMLGEHRAHPRGNAAAAHAQGGEGTHMAPSIVFPAQAEFVPRRRPGPRSPAGASTTTAPTGLRCPGPRPSPGNG